MIKAGLRTWDADGNILLDTTTSMFRLLGTISIRRAWRERASSHDIYNQYGSYTDAAFALGEPFFFYRPPAFNQTDFVGSGLLVFTTAGTTVSWTWSPSSDSVIISTIPYYVDISYGVRS